MKTFIITLVLVLLTIPGVASGVDLSGVEVRPYIYGSFQDESPVLSNSLFLNFYGIAGAAYENLPDDAHSFGAQANFPFFSGKTLETQLLWYIDPKGRDYREYSARVDSIGGLKLDITSRWIDHPDSNGAAIALNYRDSTSFASKDNCGAGISLVHFGKRKNMGYLNISTYGWMRIKQFAGFFAGMGIYLNEKHFTIGLPSDDEGPAFRVFSVFWENGFQTCEVIWTLRSTHLLEVDYFATIHAREVDFTDGFTPDGGLYRYAVPPWSARGLWWVGGFKYVKTVPDRTESIYTETVHYPFGGPIFVGMGHKGTFGTRYLKDGEIGIPFGIQLPGDDGWSRQYIRVVNIRDLANGKWRHELQAEFVTNAEKVFDAIRSIF